MRRVVKWGGGALAALLVLVVLVSGIGWLLATRSLPSFEGTGELEGLTARASATRDRHGVPYIRAGTHEDAARALGFLHAQDRLWHMHTLRMTAQGRLSELFGSATVEIDKFLRTLEFRRRSREGLARLSARDLGLAKAYAQGVNSFLEKGNGSRLPPEFLILGADMPRWEPADTLLILKLLSLQLSKNMGNEIERLKLAAVGLDPSEIEDVMPPHPSDALAPLPDLRRLLKLNPPPAAEVAAQRVELPVSMDASNNWVLAGDRTTTGKPMLANDPHLSFSTPSLWYLASLAWGEELPVTGATIPGLPVVVLGQNGRLAWGFTNAGGDVQDLYIERIDANDETRYLTPQGWRPFETVTERILVSGADPVEWTWRRTRHGPVLPDTFSDIGSMLPNGHVAALRWVALDDAVEDTGLSNLVELNLAGSVKEALSNLDDTATPQQAAVLADVDGAIGFTAPGVLPRRGPRDATLGRVPKLGWLPEGDWVGTVTGASLHRKAATSGAFGNANSRFPDQNEEPFYTADWDEPFRQDRVAQLYLANGGPFDLAAVAAGQADTHSAAMAALRDVIVDAAGERDTEHGLVSLLRDWDGRMTASAPQPMVMNELTRRLVIAIFADELKGAIERPLKKPASPLLRVLRDGGVRNWCDDIRTEAAEDCRALIVKALEEADRTLASRHGSNARIWRWDAEHDRRGEHRPFSNVAPLAGLFEVNAPTGGGAYTLLRSRPDLHREDYHRARHGAGFRAAYDLSDLDRSLYIQTTGQSGHPLSPHFDDLAPLWAAGRTITLPRMPVDPQGTWTFSPASR